jgi:peptidoglycan/xylan/chitin deacetylase (PgdA/CDA1 family)
MLYREGATQPKMMSVGLHIRLIGHPARAAGLERFLDYVAKH